MAQILCIEDEEDFRDSLVDFLKSEGHEVTTAVNGKQGLDKLSDRKFDLVLSDIGMPEMSGLDMLNQFRVKCPEKADVPFIFLTAFGQKQDIITGRRTGADDYLLKPVDFDLLHATVKAKLQRMQGIRHVIDTELDGMRGQLLQMLTHELHTPLNTILGFSDMMSAEALGPLANDKYRDFVSTIRRCGYDLMSMVNNCMDTASLLTAEQDIIHQNIDLDGLAWECIQIVKNQGLTPHVEIIQRIEPGLPMLYGDYSLISRAVASILHTMHHYRITEASYSIDIHLGTAGEIVIAFRDEKALETLDEARLVQLPLMDMSSTMPVPYECFTEPKSSTMRFVQVVMQLHGGQVEARVMGHVIPILLLRFAPSASVTA